jgi:hypothetical protein
MSNQLTAKSTLIPSNLTQTIQELSTSLTALAPANSETQMINYVLIATAVMGIFFYHYLKEQENLP